MTKSRFLIIKPTIQFEVVMHNDKGSRYNQNCMFTTTIQSLIDAETGLKQKRVNSPLDTMRDRRDQIEAVQPEPQKSRHAHKPSIYHYRSRTCTTYSEHTAYRGNPLERATCRGVERSIRSSKQSCLHITEVAPKVDEVDPADLAPLVSGAESGAQECVFLRSRGH